MIDIVNEVKAIRRQVSIGSGEVGETVTVVLRRSYPADAEDVWDALTNPERIRRWFMPISGDLRAGGNFQLEGNAGGDLLECRPPAQLRLTFGGEASVVALTLTQTGDDTVVELEHSVPLEMAGSAAGALYVGPGWDGGLLGLALHLRGEVTADPVAAANSLEAQQFCWDSVYAWEAVVTATGAATPDEIAAATQASLAQFAPALVAAQH
jgi:uncharacterized protein YndB with AHSA1/START domain